MLIGTLCVFIRSPHQFFGVSTWLTCRLQNNHLACIISPTSHNHPIKFMKLKPTLSSSIVEELIKLLVNSFRMREVQLDRYTIRSHGLRVVKRHLVDWLAIVLLGVMEIILNVIDPFHRYVSRHLMTGLRFPMKDVTIPVWIVGIYAVLFPALIIIYFYYRRRDIYDLHHGLLGLGFSVLISGVFTDALKNAVGRPRPDFFWRCFPDGSEVYDSIGNAVCHGKPKHLRDGYKSFPSGHTSWSFAGLVFLTFYLSGKFRIFNHRGPVSKLCIAFFPPLVACLVGISLVDDYMHHWQDVLGGAIVGIVLATLCYLHFFPPPYKENGWAPYAYFRALDKSSRAQPTTAVGLESGMHQESHDNPVMLSEVPASDLGQMEFGR